MGIYVYKVTGKKVTLADGTRANVAVFAYNPWGGYYDENGNWQWTDED